MSAGQSKTQKPRPTTIKLHQKSHVLELQFDDGYECNLPCEYLRVFSPSAEVQGHSPGQEVLQFAKKDVNVTALTPQGNYAVKIHFDDGHDTGLFTWEYLYALGKEYEDNWQTYLKRLEDGGKTRE